MPRLKIPSETSATSLPPTMAHPPTPAKPHVSPYLLLAAANLLWAGNWIVGRAFRLELPPVGLAFWRWVIALLCVFPLAMPHLKKDWPALRDAWRHLLLFGALGTGGYNVLAYAGLQHTTVINGTLLNSFIPVMIVVLAWIAQGKQLHGKELLGIAVSLLGVFTIVTRADPQNLMQLSLNVGDFWVLASVVAWSLYTLLLPRRPATHPLSFLAGIIVTGLLFLFPFYLYEMWVTGRYILVTASSLISIAYTGVFPAFLGYVLWNRGVAEIGPASAGLFVHLLPAFGIVLSMIFLGEVPASYHAVGIGLILGGIWLNAQRID